MKWDEWRYNKDENKPVFYIKDIFSLLGFKIEIHKMVAADDHECYHSHPAHAIRFILWGGYWEEWLEGKTEEGNDIHRLKKWKVLRIGWVKPSFSHRIERLVNDKSSYSLWIRFPKSAKVKLTGKGWDSNYVRWEE